MNVIRLTSAAVGVALSLFSIVPSSAQGVSKAGVVSGCSSGGDCAALIAAYVASLSQTGSNASAVDAELTDLTVQLGTLAQGEASPLVRGAIAAGINQAASLVSDPELRDRLQQIAIAILEGDDIPKVAASGAFPPL